MEAGNTSIKMRNTSQSILDAFLRSKAINKAQYGKLVKNTLRFKRVPLLDYGCLPAVGTFSMADYSILSTERSEGGNRSLRYGIDYNGKRNNIKQFFC